MGDIFALFLHVIVTLIRLARPGGLRSVALTTVPDLVIEPDCGVSDTATVP